MIRINKLIGLLFLAGWVTGQVFRWSGWLPVTLMDAAVGVMIIAGGIRGIRPSALRLRLEEGMWGIGLTLIVSWVLGLRLFSLGQSFSGGLYLLRFLGYLWVIVNAEKLLAAVKNWITPTLWTFVALGWIQYVFLPDTRFLLRLGWDEHYYRMIGTVLDPNYLGIMLGIIGIMGLIGVIGGIRGKWLGVAALAGIVVTFSRVSWIAVAVGLGISFWGRKKKSVQLGMLGILGILGVWLLAPKPGGEGVNLWRIGSIEQRLDSWREGIEIWQGHPWLGVGFNNYAVGKAHGISGIVTGSNRINHAVNAPSSSWILLLATTGILGIAILGCVGVVGEIRGVRINRLWLGILVMIGVHSFFNNTIFYPPLLGLLALIRASNKRLSPAGSDFRPDRRRQS